MGKQAYGALKEKLEEKDRVIAEMAVELTILRKKLWGVMGEIGRQRLNRGQKLSILRFIEQAKQKGIPRTRSCRMWEISRRRVNRWAKTCEEGRDLNNGKPGPIQPCHKLLEEEREAVLAVAKEESYMDLSHGILTVRAWDAGLFFVSFSSTYRTLCVLMV